MNQGRCRRPRTTTASRGSVSPVRQGGAFPLSRSRFHGAVSLDLELVLGDLRLHGGLRRLGGDGRAPAFWLTLLVVSTFAGPLTFASIFEPAVPVRRTTSFSPTLNGLPSFGTTTVRSAPAASPDVARAGTTVC